MTDLFASTAEYYARYRPGYPVAMSAHLRATFGLDGTRRLLDLGCGTGEVARPLHADFAAVVGVDSSPEMLEEAGRQSERAGIVNIGWHCLPAEAISAQLGSFRLITLGNAFHWMDRDAVLARAYTLVEGGGGVAILGNPGGVWEGADPWERVAREAIVRWLGPRRRTRTGDFPGEEGAETVALARSSFVDRETTAYGWSRPVDIETIIGELFSTSFASRALLGNRADTFAADLRGALLALDPTGQFVQHLRTECLIAHKR